ncbi:MAG: ABC transporter ATP-binding protein [Bacteroidales bacterium]|nr:ABC transporter ATP-binding protein [Bacteroidales bacterium]
MKEQITISANGLAIGYSLRGGRHKVIHNSLDLALRSGEVTCLLGLNGAGKSTLIKTLCGFLPPLAGGVTVLGAPLKSYSHDRLSTIIGVVLTEKTNAGGITAYDLVSLGRYPHTGLFGQLKESDHKAIAASIEAVGISHKASSYVSELSDGERQKVFIAKVLAQECPIIILDEPTAFLDVTSRIEIMVLLRKLAREQHKSILLSTHDLDSAIQLGDKLWLQERGAEDGSTSVPLVCGTPEDLILSGILESFFGRKGVVFDSYSGKISPVPSENPVGIDGEERSAFWAGYALKRNGFAPTTPTKEIISVKCISPAEFVISFPEGKTLKATSVEELLDIFTNSSS